MSLDGAAFQRVTLKDRARAKEKGRMGRVDLKGLRELVWMRYSQEGTVEGT